MTEEACNCTTPTPDPASPCATCELPRAQHPDWPDGSPFAHVPTRCVCGRPVQEARK